VKFTLLLMTGEELSTDFRTEMSALTGPFEDAEDAEEAEEAAEDFDEVEELAELEEDCVQELQLGLVQFGPCEQKEPMQQKPAEDELDRELAELLLPPARLAALELCELAELAELLLEAVEDLELLEEFCELLEEF
jgi:hypothetical protein